MSGRPGSTFDATVVNCQDLSVRTTVCDVTDPSDLRGTVSCLDMGIGLAVCDFSPQDGTFLPAVLCERPEPGNPLIPIECRPL